MKHLYILLLLLPTWLSAQISGQVQVGNSLRGLAGCTVKAYNSAAQLVATATTSANGSYELAVPAAQTVRVELSLPAATVAGSMAWSLVGRQSRGRMVKSPATIQNWQAHQSYRSSVAAPRVATPVYLHAATQAPEAAQQPAIVLSALAGSNRTALATFGQVGAVWGLAHDAPRRQVYAATLAKRHVGFGPAGSGAIYRSTVGTMANAQLLYDFDANGIATRPAELERELAATLGKAAKDAPIFSHIGQMSLGGIDLSADGRVLYVMNLYNRTLYGLYLKGTAKQLQVAGVVSYPLPVVTAKGGNWRPFAVKYHANRVFVGAVNDAAESQNAADATAIVWSLDPAQKQYTEVMRLPLNYPRASAAMQWHPWTNDLNAAKQSAYPSYLAYAQPILSDIEFDQDGAMLLGLMDRFGHQTGTDQPDLAGRGVYTGVAAGDVLRLALQKPLTEATQKQWSKTCG